MEKLQPLIKHKFWVIAGLALLLPFVGWWLSTSAVADNIQKRWEKLQGTKVTPAAGQPNQDYVAGITGVNDVLSDRQSQLNLELYNKQKDLRTWPQYVSNSMEDKHFGDRVDTSTLRIYARNLREEIESMLDDLPRYDWHPITGEETGLVYVPSLDVIPPQKKKWSNGNPPTSQVMWETQEDVWLTRSVLNAIKNVNNDAGATKITDAPIKSIFLLHFRGGSRPQETEGAAAGSPGMEGIEDGGEGMDAGGAPGGVASPGFGLGMGGGDADLAGEGGGGGPSGMLGFEAQIQMNLNAIFGSDAIQTTQAGVGDEGGGGGGGALVMPGGNLGAGDGSGTGQKTRRYVDDDPKLPYKTRGFYLEVYMLHDKLPDLQAALVSMPWPTELLMIHQVSDKLDDIIAIQDSNEKTFPPGGGQFAPGGGGEFPGGGGLGRFGGRNGPGAFGDAPGGGGGGGFRNFGGTSNRGGRFGGGGGRFPMGGGGGGGRFPMGGIGPMNPMDGEGNAEGSRPQAPLYHKAMNDFYVTRIGIAGLMTIYRSPEEIAALNAEGGEGSGEPMDAQPNENQPTDENAADTPEAADTGTAEEPQDTKPEDATDQDPQEPEQNPKEQPQPADGSQPETKPASNATQDPMDETATPPAEEAKSPPADSPPKAAPSESPPKAGG